MTEGDGEERVSVRRHQPMASVDLLDVKEARGLTLDVGRTAVLVQILSIGDWAQSTAKIVKKP